MSKKIINLLLNATKNISELIWGIAFIYYSFRASNNQVNYQQKSNPYFRGTLTNKTIRNLEDFCQSEVNVGSQWDSNQLWKKQVFLLSFKRISRNLVFTIKIMNRIKKKEKLFSSNTIQNQQVVVTNGLLSIENRLTILQIL